MGTQSPELPVPEASGGFPRWRPEASDEADLRAGVAHRLQVVRNLLARILV